MGILSTNFMQSLCIKHLLIEFIWVKFLAHSFCINKVNGLFADEFVKKMQTQQNVQKYAKCGDFLAMSAVTLNQRSIFLGLGVTFSPFKFLSYYAKQICLPQSYIFLRACACFGVS